MRFDDVIPPMATQLQAALMPKGIEGKIINMTAGGDIDTAVFGQIEACDTFVVFGSAKYAPLFPTQIYRPPDGCRALRSYGEDTGNPACTFNEAKFAQTNGKQIILIRMIPFDQKFEQLMARQMFGLNKLELFWQVGTPMPSDLADKIVEAVTPKGQAAASRVASLGGMGATPEPEAAPVHDEKLIKELQQQYKKKGCNIEDKFKHMAKDDKLNIDGHFVNSPEKALLFCKIMLARSQDTQHCRQLKIHGDGKFQTPEASQALASVISGLAPHLDVLVLEDVRLSTDQDQEGLPGAKFFLPVLGQLSCVRELKLQNTQMLRGSGIKAFLPVLNGLVQQGRLKRFEMHGTNWEEHRDKPHGATKKQYDALRNAARKGGVEMHGW